MKFFFMALPLSRMHELFDDLKKYVDSNGRVVLAGETSKDAHQETNGEHFHIAIDMNDNQYKAFYKTIIQTKYGLKGRATAGGTGRQYGLVKPDKVRDETKFLQYTVKNKNILYENIDLKTIQELITSSYIKEERKSKIDTLMEYLQARENDIYIEPTCRVNPNHPDSQPSIDITQLEFIIFEWHKDVWASKKQEVPSPSQLKSLAIRFLMYHSLTDYSLRNQQIFKYLKFNMTM